MRVMHLATLTSTLLAFAVAAGAEPDSVRETGVEVAGGPRITVRMQGPYDADVPHQVVCYFRRTVESDAKLKGAPVTLDEKLGGVIESLRGRGDFAGDSPTSCHRRTCGSTPRGSPLFAAAVSSSATFE